MKTLKRAVAILIVFIMAISTVACGDVIQPGTTQTSTTATTSGGTVYVPSTAKDLTEGVEPDPVKGAELTQEDIDALYEIYVKFFKSTIVDKNKSSLISPLSIITALGMVADGADGETLAQFETLFGITAEQLDKAINFYSTALSSTEKAKFESANSIWFTDREDFKANEDYIARVLGAYFPSLYTVDFKKSATVDDINGWVSDHTDGMIEKIVDELDPLTVMVLINAIVFDARWAHEYDEYQVGDAIFHAYNGTEQTVEMMRSEEYGYISMKNAQGFSKYYSGNNYKFVALLPDAGVDVYDFVEGLDAASLKTALKGGAGRVAAELPKFSYDYDVTLNSALKALGLNDAFDPYRADFTKMATVEEQNIYISKVLHKTHIDVDEGGTKAAAVTAVIVEATAAIQPDPIIITLDRPFVYMIVDCTYNMPIFMGIVSEISD